MKLVARLSLSLLITSIASLATSERATAIIVAADDASQSAYDSPGNWQTGDNGGFGWGGGWSLATTSGNANDNGHFIGNSGNNAGGSSGDINTAGRAWGMYASGGNMSSAVRPFSGNLTLNQVFTIEMDNGFIGGAGDRVGFSLQNSSGDNLFRFFFEGGDGEYTVDANGGEIATIVPFTGDGLSLEFTLTDADSFSFAIDRLADGSVEQTVTGDLFANANQGIARVNLFNLDAGAGGNSDAFFNSLQISAIPEPSAFLFGGLVFSVFGVNYARKRLIHCNAA